MSLIDESDGMMTTTAKRIRQEQDVDDEVKIDRTFLLGLNVQENAADEELFVLQENKVRNVGTLLALTKEDLRRLKATNKLGEEVTLGEETIGSLWRSIERKRGAGRSGTSTTSSDELKGSSRGLVSSPVQNVEFNRNNALMPAWESINCISSFISLQLKEELRGQAANDDGAIRKILQSDSKERFIDLVGELEGVHRGRRRLFVRDSMKSIVERIVSDLEGDPGKWLLLGGSSGCGKTVIGCLVVILLAARGHVILYENREVKMLVLTEYVSKEDKATLDEIIEMARIPPIPLGNQVWELGSLRLAHSEFLQSFLRKPNFIFVQDLGDQLRSSTVPHEDGDGKRLIISGPNERKFEAIRQKNDARVIIVPTWTLDEILQVEAVDPDSVAERFERIGGIPRWVVDTEKGITERFQNQQILSLQLHSLARALARNDYLDLPPEVEDWAYLIFRIEPKTETNDAECQVQLTSPYVTEKLAAHFVNEGACQILQFASVIQKDDRLSELRRIVFEGAVHRAIKGSTFWTMSIFRLDDTKAPLPVLLDVPTVKFDAVIEFEDIPSIPRERLRKGCYFYAKWKAEATNDAFALVDEAFLMKCFPNHPALNVSFGHGFNGEKLYVIFFQSTTAKEHVVDGSTLRKRQEELRELLGLPKLPMVYSFISWSKGITRRQPVNPKEAKRKSPFRHLDEFGPQYVIRLGNHFDEIAELLVT